MGVTHVIRGDDHLNNAARQMMIYEAMGWDVPVWAHIPLIHGPDGAKMSKRHGAVGIDAYRADGADGDRPVRSQPSPLPGAPDDRRVRRVD